MAVLFSLMTLSKSARFVLPVLEPQLQLPEARMFETLKNSTTFSTCRLSSLVGLNSYGRHVQPQDLDIRKWVFYKHQMIRAACVLMPATISNKYTSLGFFSMKKLSLEPMWRCHYSGIIWQCNRDLSVDAYNMWMLSMPCSREDKVYQRDSDNSSRSNTSSPVLRPLNHIGPNICCNIHLHQENQYICKL